MEPVGLLLLFLPHSGELLKVFYELLWHELARGPLEIHGRALAASLCPEPLRCDLHPHNLHIHDTLLLKIHATLPTACGASRTGNSADAFALPTSRRRMLIGVREIGLPRVSYKLSLIFLARYNKHRHHGTHKTLNNFTLVSRTSDI